MITEESLEHRLDMFGTLVTLQRKGEKLGKPQRGD